MRGNEFSNIDSLGVFLSGAVSDGGAQTDPDLSLGNYRSSTRADLIGFTISKPINGIKIERIGAANGYGIGSLAAVDGDNLTWTAPGGEPGDAIRINNSETKVLETDGDARKFIVVSRQTTDELIGIASVTLLPIVNNVIGFSNVSDTERAAGETKLRCIIFKNLNSSYKIRNLKFYIGTLGTRQTSDGGQLGASGSGTIQTTGTFIDWPKVGYCRVQQNSGDLREIVYYSGRTDTILTVPAAGRGLLGTTPAAGTATDTLDAVPGIKIAKELPVADQCSVADDENDTSEVTGFDWTTGITTDGGFVVPVLDPDDMAAVWIWLEIPAGATASPLMENVLIWVFGIYDVVLQV